MTTVCIQRFYIPVNKEDLLFHFCFSEFWCTVYNHNSLRFSFLWNLLFLPVALTGFIRLMRIFHWNQVTDSNYTTLLLSRSCLLSCYYILTPSDHVKVCHIYQRREKLETIVLFINTGQYFESWCICLDIWIHYLNLKWSIKA